MAKKPAVEQDLKDALEGVLDRPLTELESEILGLLQNHQKHIIDLEERVSALEFESQHRPTLVVERKH